MLAILALSLAVSAPPNVLFIVSDDQRPDTIAAMGNPHIETPNLDRLVRQGVAFTRAVCANPICTPSRAEILSGCSGFRNGVLDFGGTIDPALVLWPQAMQNAGYRTWYVGKWHNDGRPTDRGFQATRGLFAGGGRRWWREQLDWRGNAVTGYRGWVFQDDQRNLQPELGVGLTPDISRRFADAAIEIIRGDDAPFFLQVCFTAPHDPLLIPPGYEDRYQDSELPVPANFLPEHPFDHGNLRGRDEVLLPFPRTRELVQSTIGAYYRVITHMDEQIGRMLAALEESGKLDSTLIIFTSDHGLGVGSHGLRGKQNMYEHTINVPLVIAGPTVPTGERRRQQVYLRDLYPTVCQLTGVPTPATVEGKSFAPALRDPTFPTHDHVFCYFRDKQRMIRDDRWKLIHYPEIGRYQLFDLRQDPHELQDLAADPDKEPVRKRLQQLLNAQ